MLIQKLPALGRVSRNLIQVFNCCCDTFVQFVFATRFDRNSRFHQFIFVEQSAQTSFKLLAS